MATYSGLLIRDNFDDHGGTPTGGNIWTSPDIVPYGTDLLTGSQAISTYNGPDIGKPIVNRSSNNVFLRAMNISAQTMRGTVKLFYADASLFLLPSTWQPVIVPVAANNLASAANMSSLDIPANGIALSQAPFTLGGVPTNAHYCFIAVVNNAGLPFVVPQSFASNADFNLWVENNPNVAYRNIVLNSGSVSDVTMYSTFGNDNPVPSTMYFSMVGYRLPANTAWRAACADARLSVPFTANGFFSSAGTAATQLAIPAHIDGTTGNALMSMAFTFTAPSGQAFPKEAKVIVTYYQSPEPSMAKVEGSALRQHLVAALDPEAASPMQLLRLIRLGSVELVLNNQK
jgi:hypothetical protein